LIASQSRRRGWLAAVATIGCAAIVSIAPVRAADVDPSKMSTDAIKALEQRLIDAGCYWGAIDGQQVARSTTRSKPAPISSLSCASKPACTPG
jgi:hypothetical protein